MQGSWLANRSSAWAWHHLPHLCEPTFEPVGGGGDGVGTLLRLLRAAFSQDRFHLPPHLHGTKWEQKNGRERARVVESATRQTLKQDSRKTPGRPATRAFPTLTAPPTFLSGMTHALASRSLSWPCVSHLLRFFGRLLLSNRSKLCRGDVIGNRRRRRFVRLALALQSQQPTPNAFDFFEEVLLPRVDAYAAKRVGMREFLVLVRRALGNL